MAICLATKDLLRAVSGTRTRDPQLGKLMLYQLSYYRITFISGAKIEFYCEIAKRNHIKYLFFDQKAEFFNQNMQYSQLPPITGTFQMKISYFAVPIIFVSCRN